MKIQKDLEDKFSRYSDATLTVLMIGTAVVLVILALTIKNKWVKAAILAYEVLP